MTLTPITLSSTPGFTTRGTLAQRIGRWVDGDLVRFDGRALVPMGGWQQVSGNPEYIQSKSKIRNLLAWRDNTNSRFHVLGSADALLMQGGEYSHDGLEDILPADYTAGRESGVISKGYGAGPYGRGAYGSDWEGNGEGDGATTQVLNATVWHLGIRLGKLYATSTSDQRVLEWTPPSATTKASPVANAPDGVLCMCITQNMQILTVGDGGNRNMIRWCDSADITQWAPALDGTNNAGFVEYPLVGQPMKLMPYGQDILLFTTTALYRLSYHGAAAGYGVVKIPGESHAPIGPNAIIETGIGLAWLGRGEIYEFNGAAVSTMSCDVHDWVFGHLNRVQGWKVNSAIIPTQNEVYWWFPSLDSSEPDRYVAFDYEQGAWLKGEGLQRVAWVNPGVYEKPLAVGVDNKLYVQESGTQAGKQNMRSRAMMMIPPIPGREMVTDELHHDLVGDGSSYPQTLMRLWVANAPGEKLAIRHESALDVDGITKCRCNGKWIAVEYEITAWGKWRMGDSNLYARAGGKRGRRAPTGMRGDPSAPPTFGTPQVVSEFEVTDITSTSATVSFYVDRGCSWSTRVQGKSYSGQVVYEPVGRPLPLSRRQVLIRVDFFELLPATIFEPVFTLTNLSGGGTNEVQMPPFSTNDSDGSPLVWNMHWEDITETSATLYFSTNVAADWQVRVPDVTTNNAVDLFYTGTSVISTEGESQIVVGDPDGLVDPLPPGAIYLRQVIQGVTVGDIELESLVGGPDPEADVRAPSLTTLGTIVPPRPYNIEWAWVSGSAILRGDFEGYGYDGEIYVVIQNPGGRRFEVTERHPVYSTSWSARVIEAGELLQGRPQPYDGFVTITTRAGTAQEPTPTLLAPEPI